MKEAMKAELVSGVDEIILDHQIESSGSGENEVLWCPSCGYINEELHAASIVVEYLQGAFEDEILRRQARAWNKGFDKGSAPFSGYKSIYAPLPPHNYNRNPYLPHKKEKA